MDLESEYTYRAQDGLCMDVNFNGKVSVKSFINVESNSLDDLKAAIMLGPVSVTIDADGFAFQGYTGGILDDPNCGHNLDHAVTAVGFGTDAETGKDYTLIRNSWGADWGEDGYVRIANYDGPGMCGLNMNTLYPITD